MDPMNLPSPEEMLANMEPEATETAPTPLAPSVPTAPSPELSQAQQDVAKLTREAPQVGGIYRDNPEAFFGPVIAALVAAKVTRESIKANAIACYYSCLELVDWVRTGSADGAWAIEKKLRDLQTQWKAKDDFIQAKVIEHRGLQATLAGMKGHDAARPGLIEKVASIKQEYEKAQLEALALERAKSGLQAARPKN